MPTGEPQAIEFWNPAKHLITTERPFVIVQGLFIGLVDNPATISRKHASFFVIDGILWLIDLDSTNGTWVNGARLEIGAPKSIDPRVDNVIYFGNVQAKVGIKPLIFKLPPGTNPERMGVSKIYLLVLGADNSPVEVDVQVVPYVDRTMLSGGEQAPGPGPATQEQPRPLIEGEGRGPDASDQIA